MYKNFEKILVFLSGAVLYGLIEIIWRGYTHWSMVLAGGACLFVIHIINTSLTRGGLFVKCLIGCFVITTVEFFAGVILNIVLELRVWDYSMVWGNVLGQICPLFSALWFLITIPACFISGKVRGFVTKLQEREQL